MQDNYLQQLYANPDFSDIDAVCGQLKIHCHRSVICVRSSYFKKHYGADSPFAQSRHPKIEFDEDPAVVEALIQYIYSFKIEYQEDRNLEDTTKWTFYMELAEAAIKYQLDGLRTQALQKAQSLIILIGEKKTVAEIIDVFNRLPKFTAIPGLNDISIEMPNTRAFDLLKDDNFRQFADGYTGDKRWFWKLVNQSHVLSQRGPLVVWTCNRCRLTWFNADTGGKGSDCYRCLKNGGTGRGTSKTCQLTTVSDAE